MPSQGDVYMVNFPLPQGVLYHPGIIISTQKIFMEEEIFYIVMCSSNPKPEDFSFKLENNMFVQNSREVKTFLEKETYVKTHLLQPFQKFELVRYIGTIKKEYFEIIKTKIIESIFND